jgi:hypothetical protein
MVELLAPLSSDGEHVASELAGHWGGVVVDHDQTLDGETAWHIKVSTSPATLQPVEGFVAFHNGRCFLLDGGVVGKASCQDALESLRSSWKWIPADLPVDHADFMGKPVSVLRDQLLINYPRNMIPFEESVPDHAIGRALKNPLSDSNEFTAYIQLKPCGANFDMKAAEDALAAGMFKQFHLQERFAWTSINGLSPGAMTQAIEFNVPDQKRNWVVWAMIRPDESHVVLINFSIYTPDSPEREKYSVIARRIAESVKNPIASSP